MHKPFVNHYYFDFFEISSCIRYCAIACWLGVGVDMFIDVSILCLDEAVDGQWGMWSEWSKCSVTCGTGSMTRNRVCNNPEPGDRGRDCVGNDRDTEPCQKNDCSRWFYHSG